MRHFARMPFCSWSKKARCIVLHGTKESKSARNVLIKKTDGGTAMFFEIDKKNPAKAAAISDTGDILSYGQLMTFSEEFCGHIAHRTLLFILCKNCPAALKAYVSCLSGRIVPLLLDAGLDQELLAGLIGTYRPEYLWIPEERRKNPGIPGLFFV